MHMVGNFKKGKMERVCTPLLLLLLLLLLLKPASPKAVSYITVAKTINHSASWMS